jgi:hypothetical protein
MRQIGQAPSTYDMISSRPDQAARTALSDYVDTMRARETNADGDDVFVNAGIFPRPLSDALMRLANGPFAGEREWRVRAIKAATIAGETGGFIRVDGTELRNRAALQANLLRNRLDRDVRVPLEATATDASNRTPEIAARVDAAINYCGYWLPRIVHPTGGPEVMRAVFEPLFQAWRTALEARELGNGAVLDEAVETMRQALSDMRPVKEQGD